MSGSDVSSSLIRCGQAYTLYNLVPDVDHPATVNLVHANGKREPLIVSHNEALPYAKLAAKAFGVGDSKTGAFDSQSAKRDTAGENDVKPTRKRTARAAGN